MGLEDLTCPLGNPLTTSNDAPEKSRIRFLRVSGGIFLKMLFWKIYGFSKITSTRHKCFEKDLFTIVVAMSTESYFSLHFCWRIIIDTQLCRFCDFPWAIFPVVNWRRDLPNFNCSREIKMTMTFIIRDLDLPWSIILAKIEFTFDCLREDALVCPKLERFCSFF